MMEEAGLSHKPPGADLSSQIRELWKNHGELIAALSGGGLTLIAYILDQFSTSNLWYLYLLAYLIGGFFKAREGFLDTARTKQLNVELLMVTAAVGAAFINHWLEGAILIFIFALSGALETYSTAKSTNALSALMDLQPELARLVAGSQEQMVSVTQLKPQDMILIKPGERIPADGIIMEGETTVNEASMTGESMPVLKQKKDGVMAGTMNIDGNLLVRVTKKSEDSLFSKVLELVQSAQKEKAPTQLFIERFERIYVKAVLLVTGLMLFAPHFTVGWSWSETIYRAMVLLVVASPCALVASTTPAVLSAVAYGARNGILIKGGVHLEQLSGIKALAFDKTGTLTKGMPEVTHFINQSGLSDGAFLGDVAAIEDKASHPLGDAIVAYARKHSLGNLPATANVKVKPGYGVTGQIGDISYSIGKAGMIDNSAMAAFIGKNKAILPDGSHTTVYVQSKGKVVGLFALKDQIRESAVEAIKALKQYGIETIMLTGDNEKTAESIQKKTGLTSFIANCLPENKAEEIKKLGGKYRHVGMVGDGINDTPALAQASVGIAMGGGNDAALETADIVLMKNDLSKIADAVRLSQKMNRIVKANIIFALAVIAFLICTNFLQFLTMPFGVVGHEGSTILVILNGLRLLRG